MIPLLITIRSLLFGGLHLRLHLLMPMSFSRLGKIISLNISQPKINEEIMFAASRINNFDLIPDADC